MSQATVVGEQKQPFAITIEPANRVNPGNSQMILERRPSIGVGELAEDIEGFEQSEIAQKGALVAGRASWSIRGGWHVLTSIRAPVVLGQYVRREPVGSM